MSQQKIPAPAAPDYGYFVEDSDDECDVKTEAEPAEMYLRDFYCPLRIGQELGGGPWFRIEHKLGWGGYSTVWLARNLADGGLVALKVMSPGWRGDHERRINDEIIRKTRQDLSNHLIISQAAFYIPGRRGNSHGVLVFPWRGPSLQIACFLLPASLRVPAAKHLLLGLKHLHHAGIIHSDINAGNAMWDIGSESDHWSTATLYQRLGRPRKILLPEEVGGGELVEPIQIPESMLQPKLHLGDFGHSLIYGTTPKNPLQLPLLFCAPERFHGENPSFASDMWSFTCVFAQLYLGVEITYGDGLGFVSRLVGALGPFPAHWRGSYPDNKGYDWWYDQTGQMPRSHHPSDLETLEHRIDRCRPEISPRERELVLEVFRKGFEYIPEKRITAAQLLEDPSFNALMAYY
ncbi:kinase-like protein [Xylaria sp. FL1777]|nr:kinase-like protein [Xylaria sp. FL1777]